MEYGLKRGLKIAVPVLVAVAFLGSACTKTSTPTTACEGSIVLEDGYPTAAPDPSWWTNDTRPGGTSGITGGAAPFGCTSLQLTTDSTNAAKAQAFSYSEFGTDFDSITAVDYSAFRSSASTGNPAVATSLNVELYGADVVDTVGNPDGYTTLVFEPYLQSGGAGAVGTDVWQEWDGAAGVWWSSRATNSQPNRSTTLTWAQVQAANPGAVIGGFGLNLGSYNPGQVVGVDGLTFGSQFFDF